MAADTGCQGHGSRDKVGDIVRGKRGSHVTTPESAPWTEATASRATTLDGHAYEFDGILGDGVNGLVAAGDDIQRGVSIGSDNPRI